MTGFHMQAEDRTVKQMNDQPSGNLPFLKPDDIQYFDKLLVRIVFRYLLSIVLVFRVGERSQAFRLDSSVFA